MASTVDETPSATLTASVMGELDVFDTGPPQDEYAGSPPAYDTFDHAYASWLTADKAKQDITAINTDPAVSATERALEEAKEALKGMKATTGDAFGALHPERKSFISFLSLGKSKRDSAISHAPDSKAEKFKRAQEVQMKQDGAVKGLEEKVAAFKRKKEELNNVASGGSLAWTQLRRIASERIPDTHTTEAGVSMGTVMSKLESVEKAYDTAKKTVKDFARARLAVQNSHSYLAHALRICDDVRGTSTGRAVMGALGGGGGINDMTKMIQYRQSVTLASKAQICLNEMFRVLQPYEHLLPDGRMEDYKVLRKIGIMQMSKIYNLMFGGSMVPTGVSGSVKWLLERQEAAFAHLTNLGVWIQDHLPVSTTEEIARDDIRREAAAFWVASINSDGQAYESDPTDTIGK